MLNINFDPFPVLSTARLLLRPVSCNDLNEVFFLRSDAEVMRYIGKPPAASPEETIAYIHDLENAVAVNEGIVWAITLKNEPALIGLIGFRRFYKEHYRGELGYGLHPGYHGKGIMQEAFTAVLTYGFEALGLHSVEANVDKENIASIKLLERNNFVKEAHFRENYFFEGKFIDSVIYSLISP